MKTTALITLPKTTITKTRGRNLERTFEFEDDLTKQEAFMDKFLAIYEKQMERIHKLVLKNELLEKENAELKCNHKLLKENTREKKPKEEKEQMLDAISYDKLTKLSDTMRKIYGYDLERVAYRNALVHMLYTLYQLKGQATPEQLFSSADLTEVSGYRYAKFLKRARLIEYRPTNKKGFYVLSEAGKMFIQGKFTNAEDFCEILKVNNVYMWR